ncbi:MAG: hypothetical protein RBU29_04075 [bacterium]|jgi:hypothetical protein|nr:hypothetical protein [bacterium]
MVDILINDSSTPSVPEKTASKDALHPPYSFPLITLFFFLTAILVYMVYALRIIDYKYIDFGDGNYLYISWRLALGEILYRDVPSPQPPLHLFLGSFLLSLSQGDPILVRVWQVVQHVLIACCVLGIALRIFRNATIASLAGAIYLFLPEGVWWSTGYQSEPLLILFQSFNLLLFLTAMSRKRPSAALYVSAVVSALGGYVNMTALPYIALQWFFVWWSFRPFFWRYSLVLVLTGSTMFILMFFYSHGQYIEHVFHRQVGTYPDEWTLALRYFIDKLYTEGGDILYYEGGFVFAAIAGMFLFAGDDEKPFAKDYLLWWGIFSLGSIIFVTKGGTVEYIFTLGVPAVAVFSAYFFVTLLAASGLSFAPRVLFRNATETGKAVLLLTLFLPALLMKPIGLLGMTWGNTSGPGGAYELDHNTMMRIANYIQFNCTEDQEILSAPAYAFTAMRKIANNAASDLILGAAFFNEWKKCVAEENLSLDIPTNLLYLYDNQEKKWLFDTNYYSTQAIYDLDTLFQSRPELPQKYPMIALFLDLRRKIMNREIPLILADIRHVFYCVPVLHQAIRDYCRPVDPQIPRNNREEIVRFYKPK